MAYVPGTGTVLLNILQTTSVAESPLQAAQTRATQPVFVRDPYHYNVFFEIEQIKKLTAYVPGT